MTLKEIKTQYAGKCATCGREIKVGWNIFFDPETKKVYCKPCGASMGDSTVAGQLTEADIAELPEELQSKLRDSGMVVEPTFEENVAMMIDALRSDVNAIRAATIKKLEDIDVKIDVTSGGISAVIESIGTLGDDVKKALDSTTKQAKKPD